ncbi:MAG: molybdopterin oxidoreductase family protein [Pseudomonadota bacterium]
MSAQPEIHYSACPHDCPSTCALEVEKLGPGLIGKVRGASENTYTAGVICSKVARYSERIHHPERLLTPMRRTGEKGSNDFSPIGWDDALDVTAEALLKAEQRFGADTVWPYYYAGTMGLVMRDGLNRLRHAKRYSGEHFTICTSLAYTGYSVGTGKLAGVDPREMADADAIVLWGTNAASTQVNVMTHALRGRRERGAQIIVVDVYENATAKQADLFVCVKPGTDGALACAVMHILFRDNHVDRKFLEAFTDCPAELEAHVKSKSPEWAETICGTPVAIIEEFAEIIGKNSRSYFRLGYGFTRQRNGAVNMHAAACIPTITGAWQHKGGGAFYNNGAIYHWNRTLLDGLDVMDTNVRSLDQSRVGPVLTNDPFDLQDGPPVTAMLIQSTNPMSVCPDLNLVQQGFMRDDLFVCVHEQFMTETAKMADIILPATMFLEHDDVYQGGGHQHIIFGPKIVDAPGECRSNHDVVCEIAKRVGAEHRGFEMTSREIVNELLSSSGWGTVDELEKNRWIDCQPPFNEAHYLDGFGHSDGRFHFKPNWSAQGPAGHVPEDIVATMPPLPDHWDVIESANETYPFRLVTAPARHFLNSSFNETKTSLRREREPSVMLHPDDAAALGVLDGARVSLRNERGAVELTVAIADGHQRGVVVVESLWPNHAFKHGLGINALTGADPAGPIGGAAFHDSRVKIDVIS